MLGDKRKFDSETTPFGGEAIPEPQFGNPEVVPGLEKDKANAKKSNLGKAPVSIHHFR